MKNIRDWLFKTKKGKLVYYELPNVPIILAVLFYVISALTGGDLSNMAELIGRTFLIFWALMEIAQGVNRFRKILGFVVLIILIINMVS